MKMALTETSPLLVAVLRATNGLRNAKRRRNPTPVTPHVLAVLNRKKRFMLTIHSTP